MVFSRHKRLVISILTLFFMCFLLVSWAIYNLIKTPILSKNSTAEIICLDRSASAYQFATLLKNKNLIQSRELLLLIIRFEGLSNQLQAGVYQINPGETVLDLLHKVVSGDVLKQNFIIIEGSTQKKIAQDLITAPYLDYHSADWDAIKENHSNAEGLLLADTYQYRGGSAGRTILEQAHRHLMDYLNYSWTHQAADVPYRTPYQLLIAASIIEKETAIPQERALISGVIVNRLKKNMPLQMDPTVIYGLGSQYTGKLSHNDMQFNSPYNSYLYRGLPPTPIAMVGKEAIDAAAHPQISNYLYFVAKGDGSHHFSETYEQQKKAINQYRHRDF